MIGSCLNRTAKTPPTRDINPIEFCHFNHPIILFQLTKLHTTPTTKSISHTMATTTSRASRQKRHHRRSNSDGSTVDGSFFIPGITGKARCLEEEEEYSTVTRSTSRRSRERSLSSSTLFSSEHNAVPMRSISIRKNHRNSKNQRQTFFIPGINGPSRCLDDESVVYGNEEDEEEEEREDDMTLPSLSMSSISGRTFDVSSHTRRSAEWSYHSRSLSSSMHNSSRRSVFDTSQHSRQQLSMGSSHHSKGTNESMKKLRIQLDSLKDMLDDNKKQHKRTHKTRA